MTQAAEQAASVAQASGLSPMQQELLNRADAIFASIGAAVSKASDAAIAAGGAVAREVPDIAFQYIAFGRAYNAVIMAVAFALIVMCYHLFFRVGMKNAYNIDDVRSYYGPQWGGRRIFYAIMGAASGVVGGIVFLVNIKDTVMVWAAPKVWLMLEMVELIRKVRS